MSRAFEVSQVIRAEASVVWAVLTDWSLAADWMPGVTGMTADGPPRPGTTLSYQAGGRPRTSTVVAVDDCRALTLRSVVSGVTADYRYTLIPQDGATRVTLDADVRTAGVFRLLGPVIRRAIARADSVQLERLDRVVIPRRSDAS
jgi:carbon monoxide dehydrogenase subunit G